MVYSPVVDARALFERLITMFPPERSRPIWERWARYEYQFGNLQAAQNLEKRMAEAFPSGMPVVCYRMTCLVANIRSRSTYQTVCRTP